MELDCSFTCELPDGNYGYISMNIYNLSVYICRVDECNANDDASTIKSRHYDLDNNIKNYTNHTLHGRATFEIKGFLPVIPTANARFIVTSILNNKLDIRAEDTDDTPITTIVKCNSEMLREYMDIPHHYDLIIRNNWVSIPIVSRNSPWHKSIMQRFDSDALSDHRVTLRDKISTAENRVVDAVIKLESLSKYVDNQEINIDGHDCVVRVRNFTQEDITKAALFSKLVIDGVCTRFPMLICAGQQKSKGLFSGEYVFHPYNSVVDAYGTSFMIFENLEHSEHQDIFDDYYSWYVHNILSSEYGQTRRKPPSFYKTNAELKNLHELPHLLDNWDLYTYIASNQTGHLSKDFQILCQNQMLSLVKQDTKLIFEQEVQCGIIKDAHTLIVKNYSLEIYMYRTDDNIVANDELRYYNLDKVDLQTKFSEIKFKSYKVTGNATFTIKGILPAIPTPESVHFVTKLIASELVGRYDNGDIVEFRLVNNAHESLLEYLKLPRNTNTSYKQNCDKNNLDECEMIVQLYSIKSKWHKQIEKNQQKQLAGNDRVALRKLISSGNLEELLKLRMENFIYGNVRRIKFGNHKLIVIKGCSIREIKIMALASRLVHDDVCSHFPLFVMSGNVSGGYFSRKNIAHNIASESSESSFCIIEDMEPLGEREQKYAQYCMWYYLGASISIKNYIKNNIELKSVQNLVDWQLYIWQALGETEKNDFAAFYKENALKSSDETNAYIKLKETPFIFECTLDGVLPEGSHVNYIRIRNYSLPIYFYRIDEPPIHIESSAESDNTIRFYDLTSVDQHTDPSSVKYNNIEVIGRARFLMKGMFSSIATANSNKLVKSLLSGEITGYVTGIGFNLKVSDCWFNMDAGEWVKEIYNDEPISDSAIWASVLSTTSPHNKYIEQRVNDRGFSDLSPERDNLAQKIGEGLGGEISNWLSNDVHTYIFKNNNIVQGEPFDIILDNITYSIIYGNFTPDEILHLSLLTKLVIDKVCRSFPMFLCAGFYKGAKEFPSHMGQYNYVVMEHLGESMNCRDIDIIENLHALYVMDYYLGITIHKSAFFKIDGYFVMMKIIPSKNVVRPVESRNYFKDGHTCLDKYQEIFTELNQWDYGFCLWQVYFWLCENESDMNYLLPFAMHYRKHLSVGRHVEMKKAKKNEKTQKLFQLPQTETETKASTSRTNEETKSNYKPKPQLQAQRKPIAHNPPNNRLQQHPISLPYHSPAIAQKSLGLKPVEQNEEPIKLKTKKTTPKKVPTLEPFHVLFLHTSSDNTKNAAINMKTRTEKGVTQIMHIVNDTSTQKNIEINMGLIDKDTDVDDFVDEKYVVIFYFVDTALSTLNQKLLSTIKSIIIVNVKHYKPSWRYTLTRNDPKDDFYGDTEHKLLDFFGSTGDGMRKRIDYWCDMSREACDEAVDGKTLHESFGYILHQLAENQAKTDPLRKAALGVLLIAFSGIMVCGLEFGGDCESFLATSATLILAALFGTDIFGYVRAVGNDVWKKLVADT